MREWPVTFSLPLGLIVSGITTWAVNLGRALAETGRNVRLVVHDGDIGHAALDMLREAPPGLEVIRAPDLGAPENWPACVHLYRRLLPTVLLPNNTGESYALAAALATTHGDQVCVVGWNHLDSPYDYQQLSYYAPIVRRYVAVSQRCREELARRLPPRDDEIALLPYGVPIPPRVERPTLHGRPIRLIYAGRMQQSVKRVFDYVTLARELDRRGIAFELRLVGDGPQAAELATRLQTVSAELTRPTSRVWLEAPVPAGEMGRIWSWADAALLTSVREGFSVGMVESMAQGCVPVVSRVDSGVGDIVRLGETGLTFPVGDIGALADHVERLAAAPADVTRLSAAARAAADEMCGYQRYFTRVCDVLRDAQYRPSRHWPPTRPVHMQGESNTGGGTVPTDAADRLRRVLRQVAEEQAGPVAIYGAGQHTRALAEVLAASPVDVVAVVDDDVTLAGRRLWGWPIITVADLFASGARSVVISSWLHEEEICRSRAEALRMAGLRLYRLYARAEAAALPGSG